MRKGKKWDGEQKTIRVGKKKMKWKNRGVEGNEEDGKKSKYSPEKRR